MKTTIIGECGYEQALFGCGLSYGLTSGYEFDQYKWPFERMVQATSKLAHLNGGHNKFLESIVVWLDIMAPRYWWQEFDTYRVGTSKQSESTMHSLAYQEFTASSFESYVPETHIDFLNKANKFHRYDWVKGNLPESFIQRRVVCTNYKVLRNIINQRREHRLRLWQDFIKDVTEQVNHPELLPKSKE